MTEVLRPSPSPEPSFISSSLRRNTSHSSVLIKSQSYGRAGSSPASGTSSPTYAYADRTTTRSSSAPTSPHASSNDLSSEYSSSNTPSSTPLSSLSLQESPSAEDDPETWEFPAYEHTGPPPSDASEGSSTPTSTKTASPPPPAPAPTPTRKRSGTKLGNARSIGDDTALKHQPSRHVDYLSHNWVEEDIWSSWKHIITQRGALDKSERLENASWRAWAKSRSKLPTVSPERVNWMKDHDVTWLYGPLQSNLNARIRASSPTPQSRISRTDSFAIRKSCLKKRSLSEAMLQRSLSTSTLVDQAVNSLLSQHSPTEHVADGRMPAFLSRRGPFPAGSEASDTPSELASTASTASSGADTPCKVRCRKRHIHFSEQVEQCIAIDEPDSDPEDDVYDEANEADDEERMAHGEALLEDDEGESSDDGVIMMAPADGKERRLSSVHRSGSSSSIGDTPRSSFSGSEASIASATTGQGVSANKTIAMLPSTRLKYRGDTPEPPERPILAVPPTLLRGGNLPISASQETLKPTRPSANFLLDDDEEDVTWHPSPAAMATGQRGNDTGFLDTEAEARAEGLRRTASGMLMPVDDGQDRQGDGRAAADPSSRFFARIADTVNTAKDIAHVFWNVGWRQ